MPKLDKNRYAQAPTYVEMRATWPGPDFMNQSDKELEKFMTPLFANYDDPDLLKHFSLLKGVREDDLMGYCRMYRFLMKTDIFAKVRKSTSSC